MAVAVTVLPRRGRRAAARQGHDKDAGTQEHNDPGHHPTSLPADPTSSLRLSFAALVRPGPLRHQLGTFASGDGVTPVPGRRSPTRAIRTMQL